MSVELFKSILPTVQNVFEDGKQQTFYIKEQIPFVEAQVTANIPTPESILNVLPAVTNPNQFNEIQAKFIQLKEGCKKVEKILTRLIKQIDGVLDKLERIDRLFGTVEGFISLLVDFIPLFRMIISTAQITLAAQVGFLANGAITIRVGDAIKYLKAKIKEINTLSRIIGPISRGILKETNRLRQILYPVRSKLQNILTEVRARCFYLDSVLIEKLKELELSMTQNPGTGTPQPTEDIVTALSTQFPGEPELILDNLENSNKEIFIQYLVENGFTGYQVVKN